MAIAHTILCACWHTLTNQVEFADLGPDHYQQRDHTDRRRDHLIEQLQAVAYGVALTQVA